MTSPLSEIKTSDLYFASFFICMSNVGELPALWSMIVLALFWIAERKGELSDD